MAKPLHLTEASFESEVLQSGLPVLVDFTAEWCGPCHMLAPIVAEIAQEMDGRLKVGSLDIDENMNTAMQYGVMSVPTLMLFKDGQPAERLVGYMPKDRILARLKPHLS